MRTFADREKELAEGRYDGTGDDTGQHNPKTPDGARAILASRGGKKAAQLAIAELWAAHKREQGSRRAAVNMEFLSAPARVLRALETLRLIEETHDHTGLMDCFRLTESGLRAALVAEKAKEAREQ